MSDLLSGIAIFLVIMLIIVLFTLWITGKISGAGTIGPTGPPGPPGPKGQSINNYAHFFWNINSGTNVLTSGQNVPFQSAFITSGYKFNQTTSAITFVNAGLYLVSFGYSSISPNQQITLSILLNGVQIGDPYTLSQIIGASTGGQSITLYLSATAGSILTIVNETTTSVTFTNTAPIGKGGGTAVYLTLDQVM